jgi:hypothetical protein
VTVESYDTREVLAFALSPLLLMVPLLMWPLLTVLALMVILGVQAARRSPL